MKTVKILGDTLNKVADTSTVFDFRLWNEGQAQDVTGKTVSFTIANDSGYLFDVPAVVDGNVVSLDFSNEKLKQLTPDTYHMEVSVTNSDGDVEVYPSQGTIDFRVGKNLHSTQGKLVPQITFDTVLRSVDEKIAEYTSTIDKGDKGDQGIQGPQGERGKQVFKSSSEYYDQNSLGHWWSDLTPAVSGDNPPKNGDTIITSSGDVFQINAVNVGDGGGGGGTFGVGGLLGNIKGPKGDTGPQGPKGDMDLSQISVGGRNLVLGTSDKVVQATNWNMQVADIKYDESLGRNLYASVLINNADHADTLSRGSSYIVLENIDTSGNILKSITGNSIKYNANGISQCSISMDDNTASVRVRIRTNNMMANTYYSRLKVERGNVPTDWSPAPEDPVSTANSLTTRVATFTDFNDVAKNMTAYSGNWQIQGAMQIANSPYGIAPRSTYVSVQTAGWNDAGSITYYDFTTKDFFVGTVTSGKLTWTKLANDANVVHNTGNETIAGDKSFTGNVTATNINTTTQIKIYGLGTVFTTDSYLIMAVSGKVVSIQSSLVLAKDVTGGTYVTETGLIPSQYAPVAERKHHVSYNAPSAATKVWADWSIQQNGNLSIDNIQVGGDTSKWGTITAGSSLNFSDTWVIA